MNHPAFRNHSDIRKGLFDFLKRLGAERDIGRQRIVVQPDALSADLPIAPGSHMHESWEMRIPLGGRYVLHTPRQKVVAPNRSLLLIAPGAIHISHRYVPNPGRRTRCLCLMLTGAEVNVGLQIGSSTFACVLTARQLDWLAYRMMGEPSAIQDRLAATDGGSAVVVRYRMGLLAAFLASLAESLSIPEESEVPPAEAAAERAMRLLQDHYAVPDLTLDDVAAEVGYTPNYLATIFRRHFGQPIRQTLIEIRLHRAQTLLRDRTLSVKQAAYLTGWTNQLYFSRAFHNRFGYPPSETRKAGK
jgi:AraC-like DNA-binding protein